MSVYQTGLVSISFRRHTVPEILTACAACGLQAIEWGGDVHVPAGDVPRAQEVLEQTRAAGLSAYSYGSYLRLGAVDEEEVARVAASAGALGTRVVRVWGGVKGSAELTTEEYRALVTAARRACHAMPERTLALECHMNTVTDDCDAALRFLQDVGEENLAMYWQPHQFKGEGYNLRAARLLAPYVKNVHVFHWRGRERLPLAEEAERWRRYADILGDKVPYMLEFMPDDRLETLAQEANALREILK